MSDIIDELKNQGVQLTINYPTGYCIICVPKSRSQVYCIHCRSYLTISKSTDTCEGCEVAYCDDCFQQYPIRRIDI